MRAMAGLAITLFFALLVLSGCATPALKSKETGSLGRSLLSERENAAQDVRADRMLVWKAYLTLETADVPEAMKEAVAISERYKGYVEQKSDNSEEHGSLRLRIPAASFKDAIAVMEGTGDVVDRSVAAEDVTEQYVDVEARIKNKIELRDRLRQLLQKATEVKDIISIETELNRVQSDIDAMEARMRSMKGQVDYATLDMAFHRKKILGPLGYLFKGVWWGIGKLFVIR